MCRAAADRFAPLLGAGVLRWETEAGPCRVTYFQPDGEVIGPVDTTDARALDALADTFARRQVLHATAATGRRHSRLLGEASAASADPADRRRAFATVLGVPHPEHVAPADSNPSTPVLPKPAIVTVFEPGWPINAVVIALALALFGSRLWLGWWLKRVRRRQQAACDSVAAGVVS